MATVPFLLSQVAVQAIVQGLIEVGQASEEVFRGDRLPLLPLREQTSELDHP
jgi:hypothetical protein